MRWHRRATLAMHAQLVPSRSDREQQGNKHTGQGHTLPSSDPQVPLVPDLPGPCIQQERNNVLCQLWTVAIMAQGGHVSVCVSMRALVIWLWVVLVSLLASTKRG